MCAKSGKIVIQLKLHLCGQLLINHNPMWTFRFHEYKRIPDQLLKETHVLCT